LRETWSGSSSYGKFGHAVKSGASSVVAYATGCDATNTPSTALRISVAIRSCCSGPFRQFTPRMSAPASASCLAHSAGLSFSYERGSVCSNDIVTITGRPVAFARSTKRSASPR
jgi:hypothetical protein